MRPILRPIFISVLAVTSAVAQSFCPESVVKYYDLVGEEWVWASDTANNGFLYVAGGLNASGNNDAFIMKTDLDGLVIWTRKAGAAGFEEFRGVTVSADGGCITVGHTSSFGNPARYAILFANGIAREISSGSGYLIAILLQEILQTGLFNLLTEDFLFMEP